uniref:Magnesium transporter MgtE intracellular domain-containing protein n=1 Tax=Desulfobacca acetoxidans TaxID=60893 RepID=A0A7C5AKU5_9BACT
MATAGFTTVNLKTLTGCLLGCLLLKIGLSMAFLLPRTWLPETGPKASEAAISSTAPETPASLPRLLSLVEKERRALLAREAAAAAKEEQLVQLKKEVEERLKELQTLQNRVLEILEEEKRIQGEHNRHLVATLQAMSPDRASKLLEKMEDEEAVRLLRRLPGKEAGAILSLLNPDKAARLSHRLLK